MAYTTTAAVRLMTNLTTSDVSDADVTSLITEATVQLNSDVNVQVIREPISFIDNTRQNKINSSNTTYYVRNWHGKFIADRDDDGDVSITDVIVYQVAQDGTETKLTVSSIDDDDNNITLSSAPAPTVRLFITYSYSYVRQANGNVNPKVKLATTFLTAAYCYAKINWGRAPSSQFGSTRLSRHMNSYQKYKDRYDDEIKKIHDLGEIVQSRVSPLTT